MSPSIADDAINIAYSLVHADRPAQHAERRIMGGPFSCIAVSAPTGLAEQILDEIARLESIWSRFIPSSDISQLNNAEGAAVVVHRDTIRLIEAMVSAHQMTKGYFDPTTLPATLANGYSVSHSSGGGQTELPSSARSGGDLTDIRINRAAKLVTLPIGLTLDPGGIGKGLAADIAVEFALEHGAQGVLVDANGDVVAHGVAPDGQQWRIGVEHPWDDEAEMEQLHLVKGAVATSSRLVNVWQKGNSQTHHLIDPRTGLASETSVVTCTVVAATGAQAEAFAKIPFMGGVDEALDIASQFGVAMCVVDEEENQHTNAEWELFI